MSDAWKQELAEALSPQKSQIGGCEAAFVEALREHLMAVALESVQKTIDLARVYFDCRFGPGTPEAQAGLADLTSIITQCAIANAGLLLRGGFAAYAQAVFQCVVGKLLGGGTGGGGNGGGGFGGFQERPVNRC